MTLHIYDPRERRLVALADALLGAGAALAGPFRRRRKPADPRRILLLRLERIGDLLMALPGIAAVRELAPDATIDLVVGSWNEALARAIPTVNQVETLDAPWLARGDAKLAAASVRGRSREWRRRGYDLGINFEPDIRTNLLLAAAMPAWTAGYRSAGGGALLDEALDYDITAHTADNARRLVAQIFGKETPVPRAPLLAIPDEHRRAARTLIGAAPRPVVALHASGGRAIKQWEPERFAEVARMLVASRGATIVLTGSDADRPLVDRVKSSLPSDAVVDVAGSGSAPRTPQPAPRDTLLTTAAILAEADLLITGDTGPMHLAHAVGTPIVAVFGPSDPRRYAPRGPLDRVVRVDLPCAPCNRIRLPPARCQGHTPDCLALVSSDRVLEAATAVLDQRNSLQERRIDESGRNGAPASEGRQAGCRGPRR